MAYGFRLVTHNDLPDGFLESSEGFEEHYVLLRAARQVFGDPKQSGYWFHILSTDLIEEEDLYGERWPDLWTHATPGGELSQDWGAYTPGGELWLAMNKPALAVEREYHDPQETSFWGSPYHNDQR